MGGRVHGSRCRRQLRTARSSPVSAARAPTAAVGVALLFLLLVAIDRSSVRPASSGCSSTACSRSRTRCRVGRDRSARPSGRSDCSSSLWMVIPSLAAAQGWPARMARDSWMVAAIQRLAPRQPAKLAAWGLAISEAPYPSALGPSSQSARPGASPRRCCRPPSTLVVRRSIVKVTGEACHQIQDGSGWVAAPGIVVTNAHVVAGERSTDVVDASGTSLPPRSSIDFDPVRDLAVLSVPQLTASPLALVTGAPGDAASVYGHPGGGPLQAAPAAYRRRDLAVGTTSTAPRRAAGTCSCSRRRSRPATRVARSVDRAGAVVGRRVRDRPRPQRDRLRAHRRRGPARARRPRTRGTDVADTGGRLVE